MGESLHSECCGTMSFVVLRALALLLFMCTVSSQTNIVIMWSEENYVVMEGESVLVCAEVMNTLAVGVEVDVTLLPGTAQAGNDYDSDPLVLTIPPGESSGCVEVVTLEDTVYEDTESFSAELKSSDRNIIISGDPAIISIQDNTEVVFSLEPASACEGSGTLPLCVVLQTSILTDVTVTLSTSDGFATASEDYEFESGEIVFTSPLLAPFTSCVDVTILDDAINEPCEDFTVSLSSESDRAVLPAQQSVIIYDDEDISTAPMLMNNSPQVSGRDLTAYYTLNGCASVTCGVREGPESDCSPSLGSFEGSWFGESVTTQSTPRSFYIEVSSNCPSQQTTPFVDRIFRTDNSQCSVHFTDQQYEVDPVSGDVTVEWEGTGPSAAVQVSQFNCRLSDARENTFGCTSPLVLEGLTAGSSYTLSVIAVSVEGCFRTPRRKLVINL